MSSHFALNILLFAGEYFLATTLILALARLAAIRFRQQASMRHLVWLVAFGALLVHPVLTMVVPPHIIFGQTIATPSVPKESVSHVPAVRAGPAEPALDAQVAASGLLAIWLAGVCWIAFQGAMAAFGLHVLRRSSVAHIFDDIDMSKLVTANGKNWELRISTVPNGAGPITWGFLKPIILLPKNSVFWSRDRLETVLLHELAHVHRYDSLTQSLSLLACALYWPNPLVWICARIMRREAEMAADDAVIASGVPPSTYAGELLQLAAKFRGRRPSFSGIPMAGQSALEERVKSILATTQLRAGVTSMDALKIACLGLLTMSLLVFARPGLAEAQNAVRQAPADASNNSVTPVPPATAVEPAAPSARVGSKLSKSNAAHTINQDRAKEEAQEALTAVRPEIEKAIAQAKIAETVARAMQQAQPQIEAAVSQAIAQVQPKVEMAIAQAHISETVARALAQAQPEIDAAIARAKERAAKQDSQTQTPEAPMGQ